MATCFAERDCATTFVDAGQLMDDCHDDRFERIRSAGYTLRYSMDRTQKRLIVHAYDANGGYVGEAKFKKGDDFSGHCGWTVVHPDHRRHGVNSAMYLLAAKIFNCAIVDHWSDHEHQTADAKKFWAAQTDPFV